jgi:hypothetical protein
MHIADYLVLGLLIACMLGAAAGNGAESTKKHLHRGS